MDRAGERTGAVFEGERAQGFVTTLIVLNAVSRGLETDAGIEVATSSSLRVFYASF